jgi:hypothetical protein
MVWRGRFKVQLLSMMLKIESKKIKLAYGIIRDIKGYYIHFCLSSNLSIEKFMTVIRMSGTSEWYGVGV